MRQKSKRERSFHVNETVLAEALVKYLKNLRTENVPKEKKGKKKRYRIGLERETEEFLQQVLYHGKDVVFIQTAMEITHFHCKTITLAVICDEQF